jgi:putative glycosyltransferase
MKLSIVTTLYHSGPYIGEFYKRMCAEASRAFSDYEIIFVNDGSPDNALEKAVELYKKDERVRVIDLSRNFGHHKAIMTGLAHAKGDLVLLIDCDLEEDPEELRRLYPEWKSSGADVVYGVQRIRTGDRLRRAAGSVFYKVFNLLSTAPITPNLMTLRLMSQRYVSALVQHQEREICISGLWVITGFTQVPLVVEKHCKGSTTYNAPKVIALLVNAITSFSNKPLVIVFYLGFGIMLVSSVAAVYLIVRRVFFGVLLIGWPSLIVSIWLLGGLTIFSLGIVGIYVSKIFIETKQRPYTVIRKLYERGGEANRDLR